MGSQLGSPRGGSRTPFFDCFCSPGPRSAQEGSRGDPCFPRPFVSVHFGSVLDQVWSHFGHFGPIVGAVPPAQALPVHVINLRSQGELFPARIHPEISGLTFPRKSSPSDLRINFFLQEFTLSSPSDTFLRGDQKGKCHQET